ncbi:MAG TPA: hypothetical protein VMW54_14450 [Terriglobia bacterium]|nr:hypothetical protein [Terriglobia bacterium]
MKDQGDGLLAGSSRRDFLQTLGAGLPGLALLGPGGAVQAGGRGIPERLPENGGRRVQFGINSFLGNLGRSELRGPVLKTTPADRTNYLDAVRALGVHSIRETFMDWSDIEPVRGGGYLLDAFDDIATKASSRGIEIEALCYPFPDWATGHPAASADKKFVFMGDLPKRNYEGDFRRFIRKMVSRYGTGPGSLGLKTPTRHWIFFNEPDICYFNAHDYAWWLKVFYEEVKSADPAARVIAPALASPGVELAGDTRINATFLDQVLAAGELQGPHYPYFDVLDFHNYPQGYGTRPNVYALNAAYGYVTKALHRHHLNLPIWLDETGDNSKDFNLQAERVVKYLAHAASLGFERINLHGLWDFYPPEFWGVLENTPSGEVPVRKPSFFAFQALVSKIGKNRGVEFLGPGRYKALRPSAEPVYVLWSEGANTQTPCFLKGRLRVTNVKNQQAEMDAANLKLSESPIFVERLP